VKRLEIGEKQDDLVRRLRRSDQSAFSEIFDALHAPVLRYVQRILRDEDESYDVLQDVFTKLWEGRKDLNVHSSLKALIYRMARNRALNVLRKNDRMIAQSEIEAFPEISDPSPSAEAFFSVDQLSKRLAGWVSALPPRRAEAFVLSRYHELSADEISNLMNLSKRTVETHILHALRDLRAQMNRFESTDRNV